LRGERERGKGRVREKWKKGERNERREREMKKWGIERGERGTIVWEEGERGKERRKKVKGEKDKRGERLCKHKNPNEEFKFEYETMKNCFMGN
jgi:hypothetical protein